MAILTLAELNRNSNSDAISVEPSTTPTWPNLREWIGGGSTVDAFDADSTGAGSLTVEVDADDRVGFIVTWLSSDPAGNANAVLTVSEGTQPGAWRKGAGNYTLNLTAAGATCQKYFIGPFESARFGIKADTTAHARLGKRYISFTLAATSSGGMQRYANIVGFKMPTVSYST
jgi:hypothetical protein